jgi:hypothetical protein
LVVLDIGLVGFLPREALEPMLVAVDVPRDRALRVVGKKVASGRYADCWDHVAVELGDGDVARYEKLGDAAVDFARLAFIDRAALDAWKHEDSLDGKADVVFWGRDAAALAKAMRAPKIAEGYGWTDLAVADADAKNDRAARLKSENRWLLATDLRPHSHHFHALAADVDRPHAVLARARVLVLHQLGRWRVPGVPRRRRARARGAIARAAQSH